MQNGVVVKETIVYLWRECMGFSKCKDTASGGERNYSTCCSIPHSPGQTLQNLDWILSLLPEDCQVKMEEEMDRKESEKENAW